VELRVFFLKTCGLLVFGLVQLKFACFLGLVFAYFCVADCFFSNVVALLLFQIYTAKGILGVFL